MPTQTPVIIKPTQQTVTLPTMYDLPSENPEDPGLPDHYHYLQPHLLDDTLRPPDIARNDYFSTGDMSLYYDPQNLSWYKRPDWFLALDVPRLYQGRDSRMSYVLWDEKVPPYLVVELISPGTQTEDFGKKRRLKGMPPSKWTVYEQIVQVPYYVIFNRYKDELTVYELIGTRYRQATLPDNRLWLPRLKLGLGLWEGAYRGMTRLWLRWYDANDTWLPTPEEQTIRETARAEQEASRAEQAIQQAELYAAKLRALGIDPDSL